MSYTKLFHRIITSSIWDEPNSTRIVWITMLAMANQDGYVGSTFKSLALLSRTTDEECKTALTTFLSPDSDSRSSAHEGRRIEEVEGGWRILNYEKYRNAVSDDPNAIRTRERVKRFRDKQKEGDTEPLRNVTLRYPAYASASEPASSEGGCKGGVTGQQTPSNISPPRSDNADFNVFWAAYPRKVGKKDALKAWLRAKDKPPIADLLHIIDEQKTWEAWRKDGGQYIPHPATWLNQGRWSDEKPAPIGGGLVSGGGPGRKIVCTM